MTLTQITEKGIKDGEIINADINASAAIASSKLAKPIDFADNEKARFGAGNDLEIYHASNISTINDSYGDLRIMGDTIRIQRQAGGENFLYMTEGGKVALYYDGSEKLETTNGGVSVTGQIVSTLNFRGGDGVELSLGDAEDIKIWHATDADNYIDGNSGQLYIRSNNNIYIQPADNENGVVAIANGAVELYHNNSKKLETGTGGEYGSVIARNGAGGWDGYTMADHVLMGRTSDGSCGLFNDTDNHWAFKTFRNGVIELYYDGSKKLETDPNGVKFNDDFYVLDGNKGYFGTGNDLEIYHDGSKSIINDNGTGQLYLQVGGSPKFNTQSGGVQFYGSVYGDDNNKIELGNDQDLKIYHDGSNSYIKDAGTGQLRILSNQLLIQNAAGDANQIICTESGSVDLHYNGSKKFETGSGGVGITGECTPSATDTYNLGHPSYRWANVYTSGINFAHTSDASGMTSELFDDYEEGTWTPTLAKAGASGNADSQLTSRFGYYVKSGNLLWISFYWYSNNLSFGTGTNNWYIDNLPYDLITLHNSAYQFIPGGYLYQNGHTGVSHQAGYRWQSNSTNGADTLAMYGQGNTTNAGGGSYEFSGCGVLRTT